MSRIDILRSKIKDKKGFGIFDKRALNNGASHGGNAWILAVYTHLLRARDHIRNHRYSYCLLIVSLLVLLYRRRPELFKKIINWAYLLI